MTEFTFEKQERKTDLHPFMVIYGPSGTGKTTFASNAPESMFLQTEEGGGELTINTLKDGIFQSYEEFLAALRHIYADPKGIKTVVIDSIDHLEPLVWKAACVKKGWESIESVGYGKGYIEVDSYWHKILGALNKLRTDKNMNIVCIAHDQIRVVNDPLVDPYDAHELKLHKRAVALWKESCDMIGLLRMTVMKDKETGKGKGGTQPTLFVRPRAGITAKTRYTKMPSMIPINLDTGWDDVAKYIPALNKKIDKVADLNEEETETGEE